MEEGSLGFSVTIYTICALVCIALLMARRYLAVFGKAELGGPNGAKYASAVIILSLWVTYIVLSSLQVMRRSLDGVVAVPVGFFDIDATFV